MGGRGFRSLAQLAPAASAVLPPGEAVRGLLVARFPVAAGGGLAVRLRGAELRLGTGDKNVRHQIDAAGPELVAWLNRAGFPALRRVRWSAV